MSRDLEEARWYQAWPVGVVTLALGLAPLWVTWHALRAVVSGQEPLSLSIVAWVMGPLLVSAWFFGLTYRLFTLRGRSSDGGLMGPLTLLMFSLLTVCRGFFGLYFGWRDTDLRSLYGGVFFLALGAVGLKLGIARVRGGKVNESSFERGPPREAGGL